METQEIIKNIKSKSLELRKLILDMTLASGAAGGHIGSAYSITEILLTLYLGGVLKYDLNNLEDPNRDRFILSKGHGAMAYYIALAQAGFFPMDKLAEFQTDFSPFGTHIKEKKEYGIEFSSGSLGHGLSIGAGVALTGLLDNRSYNVYVLVGDGECGEGSIWEAAMFAGHRKLNNLTVIVDRNRLQCDGFTEEVLDVPDMTRLWDAYGWQTYEVDGHDIGQLIDVFRNRDNLSDKPFAIIANTVKGKGICTFENNPAMHHIRINEEQHRNAIRDLELAVNVEGNK